MVSTKKPGRPFWENLNEPYLERLAAAGARPDEIDMVMCTHLHHDHIGWNTMQKDGNWKHNMRMLNAA